MKRSLESAGLLAVLALGLLPLTGCTSSLISPLGNSVDQANKTKVLSQIELPGSSRQNNDVVALISAGQTISGYLSGSGDYDWHPLEGVSAGTQIDEKTVVAVKVKKPFLEEVEENGCGIVDDNPQNTTILCKENIGIVKKLISVRLIK